MKTIGILKNTVQEYPWGSHHAIAELLGQGGPSASPQAELWMGAHPKAPSLVKYEGQWVSLAAMIEECPVEMLGSEVSSRFHNQLPYLFKVLAAAQPLSIQAHPSREQAEAGFERENRLAIPIGAPNRNYRDPNHKPECICALTPFWALAGFRKRVDIVSYLETIWPGHAVSMLEPLKDERDSSGTGRFYRFLMEMVEGPRERLAEGLSKNAYLQTDTDPVFRWIAALQRNHGSDLGVLSPALFNLIRLEPGQALFLPAGVPHAYLEGVGVELMANSDNVLRGGLTPKHVDIPELMRVLDFGESDVHALSPLKTDVWEERYPSKAEEFTLSALSIREGRPYVNAAERSIEILLCTEGQTLISDPACRQNIPLDKGTSVVIPASVDAYTIAGNGRIYKAAVPIKGGRNGRDRSDAKRRGL